MMIALKVACGFRRRGPVPDFFWKNDLHKFYFTIRFAIGFSRGELKYFCSGFLENEFVWQRHLR
jgi:hypothetical protein